MRGFYSLEGLGRTWKYYWHGEESCPSDWLDDESSAGSDASSPLWRLCISQIYIEIGTRKSRRCQPLSKVKHHRQLFSSSGRPTARALGRSDHETDNFLASELEELIINKNYVETCGNIIRAIGHMGPYNAIITQQISFRSWLSSSSSKLEIRPVFQ